VDGGVHMVTEVEESGSPLPEIIERTASPIGGAILTTVFGFGSMMLAHHPGLRSLGEFAVLGLTVNFLACLVGLPAFIAILQRFARVPRRAAPATLSACDPGAPGSCPGRHGIKTFGAALYCLVTTRARSKPTC
jgi:uncharacterized protein